MTAPGNGGDNPTTARRLAMLANGFWPIPVGGKDILMTGWTKIRATSDAVRSWEQTEPLKSNSGVLTFNVSTVDADILNEDGANLAEEIVRRRFGATGRILRRIGQAPKRAFPMRTETPFKKVVLRLSAPGEPAPRPKTKTDPGVPWLHKIEILADGQQFVADGVHPGTHRPYEWTDGAPWTVARADLPPCEAADCVAFLSDAVSTFVANGWRATLSSDDEAREEDAAVPMIVELAKRLWGEPTSRSRSGVRFGAHGSKAVDVRTGTWFDFEADHGGGIRDLMALAHGEGDDSIEGSIALNVVRVSDVESKKINWLWKPRIARGKITMIVGMPDTNKSTSVIDLVARVTRGDILPNGEGRAPLDNVVMLSAEDDIADTMRPRLEVAGADLTRVHVITAVKVMRQATRGFDLTQDIARMEKLIREIGGAALVVIDPVSAYMGKPGKLDSYRSTDVRATLVPLQQMAADCDAAVVGIGHLNKSGKAEALLRVLDSIAFVAAPRGVYLVARVPDDEDRRLFLPVKNNIGKTRTGLSFKVVEKIAPPPVFEAYPAITWEDGAVSMTADEALASMRPDGRRSEKAEEAKFLLREMLAGGPALKTEIEAVAENRGISAKSLRTAKTDLGVVSKQSGRVWWWSFPEQWRGPSSGVDGGGSSGENSSDAGT